MSPRLSLLVLVASFSATTCARAQDMAASAATEAAPVLATGVAPDYKIGPGDLLQVFVWRNPELTVKVPVRPDGKISTPLNEDMVAVGRTPTELARAIEARLAEYIKSPVVNIIVEQAISVSSQVSVIGQVHLPHALPFREGLTVLDAVLLAGGANEFAAPKRTKVIRRLNGHTEEIPVNLDAVLQKGDMRSNLILKAGDVIVIPEARF